MQYKVTVAKTYIVEAQNKQQAKQLVVENEATYFQGEWVSVQEAQTGWTAGIKKQLTGK